jgi:hypothetical protein
MYTDHCTASGFGFVRYCLELFSAEYNLLLLLLSNPVGHQTPAQAQSRGSPAATFPQHQLLQHQQPDAIITAGGSRTPVKWSSEYGDNCSVNSADKQTTQRRANVDHRDSVFCHPLDAVSGHSYLNVLRGNIGLRLFSVEFH